MDPQHPLVLYDGVCGLCNKVVEFVLRRDRRGRIRFAPLQSDLAAELLTRHGEDASRLETFYVATVTDEGEEVVRARARAALALARELGWPWRAFGVFGILPTFLLDAGYRFVAKRRYRWFGREESCRMPRPEERGPLPRSPGSGRCGPAPALSAARLSGPPSRPRRGTP